MKARLRQWLGVEVPDITVGTMLYWSTEIDKMHKLLQEVGLYMGEGGQVNINGVAVKFSDRLDALEHRIKKLEKK